LTTPRMIAFLFILFWPIAGAVAQAQFAERASQSSADIKGLTWSHSNWGFRVGQDCSDCPKQVTLEGRFARPWWALVVDGASSAHVIHTQSDGSFSFSAPMKNDEASILISAVGPFGQVETENMVVAILPEEKSQLWHPIGITPSLGVSEISYQETHLPDYHESALTLKLSAFFPLGSKRWELGGNMFFTALPLSSSRSDISVRFFGANLRVGYAPWISGPWPPMSGRMSPRES
jgi:hypothetical protein